MSFIEVAYDAGPRVLANTIQYIVVNLRRVRKGFRGKEGRIGGIPLVLARHRADLTPARSVLKDRLPAQAP